MPSRDERFDETVNAITLVDPFALPYVLLQRKDETAGLLVGKDRGRPHGLSDGDPHAHAAETARNTGSLIADLVGDLMGKGDEVPG